MNETAFNVREWWRRVHVSGFSPEVLSVAEALVGLVRDDGLVPHGSVVGRLAAVTEIDAGRVEAALVRLEDAGVYEPCYCSECKGTGSFEDDLGLWLFSPAGRFAAYLAERDRLGPQPVEGVNGQLGLPLGASPAAACAPLARPQAGNGPRGTPGAGAPMNDALSAVAKRDDSKPDHMPRNGGLSLPGVTFTEFRARDRAGAQLPLGRGWSRSSRT